MKSTTLLLLTVFYVAMMVFASTPVHAYSLATTYIVEISENGTASWLIERSAYLPTTDDQTSFEQLITRAITYIDQFSSQVANIIDQTHNKTGRFMTAEHIAVGGNVTQSGAGAYGFIKYSFDWTNFAVPGSAKMTLGDAFSNASFLFGPGSLSVLLPTGYTVNNCSPTPDYSSGNLLRWNTVGDLQDEQPSVLLSQNGGTVFPPAVLVLAGVLLLIAGGVLASVMVLRVRRKTTKNTSETIPDYSFREMADTERILALLKKEGGQALQSRITEQLKFSKAKTSRILGEMETKGMVSRRKNGRDKVVSIGAETENTGT
jgi:uncharacterized membrane protein